MKTHPKDSRLNTVIETSLNRLLLSRLRITTSIKRYDNPMVSQADYFERSDVYTRCRKHSFPKISHENLPCVLEAEGCNFHKHILTLEENNLC